MRSFTLNYQLSNFKIGTDYADGSFWIVDNKNYGTIDILTGAFVSGVPQVHSFNPSGFKSLDVYKIKAVGHVMCKGQIDLPSVIMLVNIDAIFPEISGIISNTAGYLTAQKSTKLITLTNTNNCIEFQTPLKAVKNISLQTINFQIANFQLDSLFQLSVYSNITLQVDYKFQGE
jgi:hypothetical protein